MIERSGRSHRQFGHFGANYNGARFMPDETGIDGQLVSLNQDALSFVNLNQFLGDKEICEDIRAGG